ncbi:MAG: hypothetical protein EOP39_16140 [Rubrivivax sp.]|nr:MAG: hypothetical protein EOP39_16140 [Rubrivivax sp.]
MIQPDQLARQDARNSGQAVCPQAKVPTYQDLLDAALDDTFPASDPLAIGAATHVHEPRTTARDCVDWTLEPGACPPAGQAGVAGQGREHSARCEAWLRQGIELGALHVPASACEVRQSAHGATLFWRDSQGRELQGDLPLERLRELLAQDLLFRPDEP